MFANSSMFAEHSTSSNDAPLNKRRRFAPNTLPVVASPDHRTTFAGLQDSPLLLQLAEQSPSQQEIEAQLLQVGMRVRKSVNEGYQSASARRAYTPRPFFNSNRLSPETISALTAAPAHDADPATSAGGVHSVGSLNMQPLATATFCGINLAMLSHISTSTPIEEQKMWSYSTASKRRQYFDEDEDSDDSQEFMPRTPQLEYADAGMAIPQDYFNISSESMVDVSVMHHASAPEPKAPHRKLAQPKSRMRQAPEACVPTINPFAQIAPPRASAHQRMRSCGLEAAMDFGEAPFLQARRDVEMDCS